MQGDLERQTGGSFHLLGKHPQHVMMVYSWTTRCAVYVKLRSYMKLHNESLSTKRHGWKGVGYGVGEWRVGLVLNSIHFWSYKNCPIRLLPPRGSLGQKTVHAIYGNSRNEHLQLCILLIPGVIQHQAGRVGEETALHPLRNSILCNKIQEIISSPSFGNGFVFLTLWTSCQQMDSYAIRVKAQS